MFRKPGMSRQAMGILASSPELMTSAQRAAAQNQPMRAQTGASVNMGNQNYVAAIQDLARQGDVATLTNIFQDTRLPTDVRNLARDSIGALTKSRTQVKTDAPTPFDEFLRAPLTTTFQDVVSGISSLPNAISVVPSSDMVPSATGDSGIFSAPLPSSVGTSGTPSFRPRPVEGIQKAPSDNRTATTGPRINVPTVSGLRTERGDTGVGGPDDPTIGDVIGGVVEDAVSGFFKGRSDLFREGTQDPRKKVSPTTSGVFAGTQDPRKKVSPTTSGTFTGVVSDTLPGETLAEQTLPATTGTPSFRDRRDESLATDDSIPEAPPRKPEVPSKKPKDQEVITPQVVEQLDPTQGLSDQERNQRASVIGASVVDKVTKVQDSDKSEDKKREETNKILGIDNLEQEYAVLKEFFGEEKAGDIRTSAGYNLMMTGLMIAAGESDNALTNIAKGAAAGLQKYGEAVGEEAQAERSEDRAIKSLVAKTALERRAAGEQQERDVEKIEVAAGFDMDRLRENIAAKKAMQAEQLAATKENLATQLGANMDMVEARLKQAADQFGQELELKRDQLNLGPAQLQIVEALAADPELMAGYAAMYDAQKADPMGAIMGKFLADVLSDPEAALQFMTEDGESYDIEKLTQIAGVIEQALLGSGVTPTTQEE